MRGVIDGVNGSQRMMWDESRGHARECGGSRSECSEVRQKRCVKKRGKKRGATQTLEEEEWRTRDHTADSAALNFSIAKGFLCNLLAPTN